jgi:SpoVK/Ycf46/Vps4 family AAA+-type ATPase
MKGGESPSEDLIREMASRFSLSGAQISAAVTAAADLRDLTEPDSPLDVRVLSAAVRLQSNQALVKLARKVPLIHDWEHLVLPANTLAQLREVTSAARYRHLVFDAWGMGKRQAGGSGVKALFSGPSGTGKTMSAGVIAGDLGLDLYQIDLAGVVSKYIGETEKNLDRIFQAARSSNAVLFFDEADALFGKRSEVKDAHDRYANIEVAYLLQKMEEYEGVAILASNLSTNIDEAFARRMHYVVEFPIPDEALRLRLWRGMIPAGAPLSPDIDLEFLAKQFRIAGGDIRNVVLTAAFIAAGSSQSISMEMMSKAMARQLIKQGKAPSATEFKQYFSLLATRESS